MRKVVDVQGYKFVVTDEHNQSRPGISAVVCPNGKPLGDADLYDTGSFQVTGAQIKELAEEVDPE